MAEAPDPRLAGRVVYTVAIQMPNVTSYSGSWMVWFAEHEPAAAARRRRTCGAPVPLRKVDPKYIAAAAAERVEGTIRLFGVIRKDGHVTAFAAAPPGRPAGRQRAGSAGEVGVQTGPARTARRWKWTPYSRFPSTWRPQAERQMTRQYLIIDADDTLWENNIYFERAFDEFVDFLAHSRCRRGGARHAG